MSQSPPARRVFSPGPRVDARGDAAVPYLRALCAGLLPVGVDDQIEICHEQGAGDDYVWWVFVPSEYVGMLVGSAGATAEAIRRLMRVHVRLSGWQCRPDVRPRDRENPERPRGRDYDDHRQIVDEHFRELVDSARPRNSTGRA